MAPAVRAAPSKNPPNQTLYCSNLPDKLQKEDLRRSLYLLFATYGPILDIVALKTSRMRGQAHIVFRDLHASIQAMRALNGFEFFGKEMRLDYAKGKSDMIAKLDGTFKIPLKETKEAEAGPTMTDIQKSVFGGVPSVSAPKAPATQPEEPKGVKRGREEEEEEEEEDSEQEDVPMEEDDDDAAMEESDEE